jgi:hypothetical protein
MFENFINGQLGENGAGVRQNPVNFCQFFNGLKRGLTDVHELFIFAAMPDDLTPPSQSTLQPGQLLARGVCRHLRSHDFVTVEELVPTSGLRVDVMALGPKGEIWVIECKSSRADFQSDHKWEGYLEWCDRYFWAVDEVFPTELLPDGTGLIIADAYDAEIIRMGPESKLAPARRKVMIQKFARHAARRLHRLRDPGVAALITSEN